MDDPRPRRRPLLARADVRALAPPVGLLASAAGLALALGIMAVKAADGTDYTAISWVAIGPTWGGAALLSLAMRWRPLAAGFPLGWLAIFAAFHFSDVFGLEPGAVLFLIGTAGVLLSAPDA